MVFLRTSGSADDAAILDHGLEVFPTQSISHAAGMQLTIAMLEKDDRTLETLFVTPLRVEEYMASKVLSLAVLAVATSTVIAVAAVGWRVHLGLLVGGVALTSFGWVLLGLALVTRFRRVTTFMIVAGWVMGLMFVPMAGHFGLIHSPLLYLFPAQASLVLIGGAFDPASLRPWEVVYATGYLGLWITLSALWARRWFVRHVVQEVGG